jgi:hypothetical protein
MPLHTVIPAKAETIEVEAERSDTRSRSSHLLRDPLRFPAAVVRALQEKDLGELWHQVIGVFGLFDTV